MDIKELEILGADAGEHWYYASKARAMERLLVGSEVSTIIDVGAGSGFFSKYLLSNSAAQRAWCVDIGYAAETEEVAGGKTICYRRSVESVDANLVLLMDVLEHVEDDVGLLREYVEKVPVGGRFFVTVPAFNFLWSSHDEFLEHKRRYSLRQLEGVVQNSGLRILKGGYFFGLVLPLAIVSRRIFRGEGREAGTQLKKHHPAVNAILKSLCRLELPLVGINRFAGLTAYCLAEKCDERGP